MLKRLVGGFMAIALAMPSVAQTTDPAPTRELPYDRGYDKPTARGDAINAQEAPVTRALNETANESADTAAANATSAQAQYDVDMAQYRAAVEGNERQIMRDTARYARQQRAYADAMAVWRVQSDACVRGHTRACELPTPVPADFY